MSLNESTDREFKKLYESEIKSTLKQKRDHSKEILSARRGRPLLLGEIDSMVQRYLIAASNRGSIISRAVATSTTKALMSKHPDLVGNIDLDASSWAKSLFTRMGFVHQLVSKVEMYGIPPSLIINIDQTPSKYVSSSRTTMAKKNLKQVAVAGSADKRTITATFAVSLDGKFLPMQLIYGGKTKQSLPQFKFPDSFSLNV